VPRIISFAWTSPAVLVGQKTVTRRDWDPNYARRFRKGDEVLAYNRSQRAGGKPIARLRLTADPSWERDWDMPDSDYEGEGFAYLAQHPELLPKSNRHAWMRNCSRESFDEWRFADRDARSWVIRFELIEVLPA
jgi:hypothetical protein